MMQDMGCVAHDIIILLCDYTISVIKDGEVVGHIPTINSSTITVFLLTPWKLCGVLARNILQNGGSEYICIQFPKIIVHFAYHLRGLQGMVLIQS